ncbi:tetratricopeptide repeat protein [Puniceibacterium confluentis]|uniref:tetratricopeptide repeat protein n=1 Tax=Puniceibacterium confluentis TaxID=1958944 RepID=UPI0011B52C19|nr:tetratricopeptide repeat protein [Puniceibacterium confluentis]
MLWKTIVLCLSLASAAAAQTPDMQLTPAQMRGLAAQAVNKGYASEALALSGALLDRDPNDFDALMVHARAARDLGQFDAARASAQQAWNVASGDEQRYAAAVANAQVLSSMGKRTSAQLWLRRAVQTAPSDFHKGMAARDYAYVRSQNPWSTQLSFNIAPSSNINNGSSSETTTLPGLPFVFQLQGAAQALSGTEISGGISTTYKLAESKTRRTSLRLSVYHRDFILSDEAKRKAPGAKGSDFALTSLTTGLDQSWIRQNGRLVLGAEATLGKVFYSGDPLYANLNLGGSLRYAFTPGLLGQFRAAREAQKGYGTRPDAHAWRGSVGLTTVLPQGHRLSTSFNYAEGSSSADYLDYADHEIDLRLELAKPVLSTAIELGLTAGHKHHARNAVTGGERNDDTVQGDVTLVFNKLDYYGFVPSLTLRARRTDSNVGIYDSEEFGLQAGIRSRF